jgi:hypothetical protein
MVWASSQSQQNIVERSGSRSIAHAVGRPSDSGVIDNPRTGEQIEFLTSLPHLLDRREGGVRVLRVVGRQAIVGLNPASADMHARLAGQLGASH